MKGKTPSQLRQELTKWFIRELRMFPRSSLIDVLSYGLSRRVITPAHLVALGQLNAFGPQDAGSTEEIIRSYENAVRLLLKQEREAA